MRQLARRSLVIVSAILVVVASSFAQEGTVFGARAGSVTVMSDSSSRKAVDVAELASGLERVASSLALPTSDKPLTVLVLDNEADLARIDPALVYDVQSRRYFAEDEAFIVLRHSAKQQEQLFAAEYARFILHEAMWNPPAWFERGFSEFFAEATVDANGAMLLESTCGAGFLRKLRKKAGGANAFDVPAPVAAVALIARFGMTGAMEQVLLMQTSPADQSVWLGAALNESCRTFSPPGEPLRIPEGIAQLQVRKRSDLLDRIASLQLRTREGSDAGIAHYRQELQRGRNDLTTYRELGIGYAIRADPAAIAYLQEAVKRGPSDFSANLHLGVQCAYDSNCDPAAINVNLRALENHASSPMVQYVLAQRALAQNRQHLAATSMKRAVALRPSDPELRKAFVSVAIIAGDFTVAEEEIARLAAWPDPAIRESAAELSDTLVRRAGLLSNATTQTATAANVSVPATE